MGRRELHPPLPRAEPVTPALSGGQSLTPEVRSPYESAFGRDFGHVRVHDDARAHDAARAMDARAFASGPDIVFGAGQYQPASGAGRGLIAHELAHVAQQSQAPQTAPIADLSPTADRTLEAEASASAAAFAEGRAMPALTRLGAPALQRNDAATPAPPAAGPVATTAGPAQGLPDGMSVITDDPAGLGTTQLVVKVDHFTMPVEKGMGIWVKEAYDARAAGGGLVYSPLIEGSTISSFKEGSESYDTIWANHHGFETPKDVGKAIVAAAKVPGDVKDAYDTDKDFQFKAYNLANASLKGSKCDIDHIVEKQIGGTSAASNLQLLDSKKNQASGGQTRVELNKLIAQIRDPKYRGSKVKKLQLVLAKVTLPPATSDGSFVIETLLRNKKVVGDPAVTAKGAGKPLTLMAGGTSETVNVKDTGETLIEAGARRLVPGMRLRKYTRATDPKKDDVVTAELDSRAISKSKTKLSEVKLIARKPVAAAPGTDAAASSAAAAAPVAAPPAAGEVRQLTSGFNPKDPLAFYYPYLSPGEFKTLTIGDDGKLTATGTITSTVPLFPVLEVTWQADATTDKLTLNAPIDAAKLKPNTAAFRFTSGALGLELSPALVPSGTLAFSVGPKDKPVINGTFVAALKDGVFTATGTLTPGVKVPGIETAEGQVTWNSETGWAGKLSAKSTTFGKDFSIDAALGFATGPNGQIAYSATGGLHGSVRGNPISLGVAWNGNVLSYSGSLVVDEPVKRLKMGSVSLKGSYDGTTLVLKTAAPITVEWRKQSAAVSLKMIKTADTAPVLTGDMTVTVKVGDKITGTLNLGIDEFGNAWGGGEIVYAFTDKLKPSIKAKINEQGRLKVSGSIALDDIELLKAWPADPKDGYKTILPDKQMKFSVPVPPPAPPGTSAFATVGGSLGFDYGVGPLTLTGVTFTVELMPLEEDKQLSAHLSGRFVVPGHAKLVAQLRLGLGLEYAQGLAGIEGQLVLTGSIGIEGMGGLDVNADYADGGFSFAARAFAKGGLVATGSADLVATVYAFWKLLQYSWTYHLGSGSINIGPEVTLVIGQVAYNKDGTFTWPSLSGIHTEPDFDLVKSLKDEFAKGKVKEDGPPPREKYPGSYMDRKAMP